MKLSASENDWTATFVCGGGGGVLVGEGGGVRHPDELFRRVYHLSWIAR